MKAYLRGVLAVTLAVMLAHYLVVATVRSPLPAEYWLREFQIAKRHQALAMASPKLILVGGSCTLFGIDAAAVQKALNVPTINFGLHAGMRLEDHLDNAREVARPGDTILLSLEPAYYDFYSQSWDTWQLRNALAWNRPSLERLSPASRVGVYLTASDTGISTDLLWGLVQSWTYSPAVLPRLRALAPDPDVSDLDGNGDLLHATDTQHSFQGTPFAVERPASISTYARDNLRPFLEEMKDRQVRVLFDYTPYVVDQPPAADWPAAEAQFRAQLAEIGGSLIERRDAFFYPTALFFNSNLHLNEKGRDLRTATLIEALKPYAQDWQRSP